MNFEKLKEPYLIAEIGTNHNGDINLAKRLIDASYIGWNSVKFQKRNFRCMCSRTSKSY